MSNLHHWREIKVIIFKYFCFKIITKEINSYFFWHQSKVIEKVESKDFLFSFRNRSHNSIVFYLKKNYLYKKNMITCRNGKRNTMI